MTCQGCFSGDVPPIELAYCNFCGRLVTEQDVRRFHAEMVAPRKALEDEREDLALRGVT